MTTFRQIVPNSFVNPTNERFEHLLVWLSPSGGVRQCFFSHTDGEITEEFENYQVETLNDIRSVPSEDRDLIETRTKSLESEQFEYVKSIFKSNRVYKVGKDFSKTPVAIRGGSVTRPNQLKEFEVRVRFYLKEDNVLNV